MSTKVLLKTLIPFGMLVVVFLAAQIVSSKSASAPASGDAVKVLVVAGPDMIKQRSDNLRSTYYARSDYIERHPSDFFTGSDWIERHPSVVDTTANLAGSDYIERHPSNFFAGSDWIERHPSVVTAADNLAGSDYIERHPIVRLSQKPGHSFGTP